jgi:hypothetical protein
MRLAAVMVSCPERQNVRRQTLENLSATDWQGDVELAIDDGIGTARIQRIDATWRKALARAAASSADLVLAMEDDLDFNHYLRENLTSWPRLAGIDRTQPFFGSLYNPGFEPMHTWIDGRCHIMHPEMCWGAQTYVVSPAMARYFLATWDDVMAEPDIRMPRLAARLVPIYYHRPSLVEHVGVVSTWGGRRHRAVDFERDWRASAASIR